MIGHRTTTGLRRVPDRPVHHGPHRGTGLGTGVNQRNGKRVVWPTPHDHCPPIMTVHGHPCLSYEDFSEVEQITLCAVNRTRHQHPDGRWDDDVDMSGNNRQCVVGQFVGARSGSWASNSNRWDRSTGRSVGRSLSDDIPITVESSGNPEVKSQRRLLLRNTVPGTYPDVPRKSSPSTQKARLAIQNGSRQGGVAVDARHVGPRASPPRVASTANHIGQSRTSCWDHRRGRGTSSWQHRPRTSKRFSTSVFGRDQKLDGSWWGCVGHQTVPSHRQFPHSQK